MATSIDSSYATLGLSLTDTTTESESSTGLGLDDFLSLMTTELQNQDPLDPMDNGEMLSQMASFATVSGIEDLQTSFGSFASSMQSAQALQGSSLIGKSVFVESSVGNMTAEDGLSGQVYVPESVTDLNVKIYTEEGELVQTMEMGAASGYTEFTWDGLDENGEAMAPGSYQFLASGTVDGENTAFATATVGEVESVILGSDDGLILNLSGIGSVLFSEALEII